MALKTQKSGTYVGQSVAQVRQGEGSYIYKNPFFQYVGDWVEGVKHGKGTFIMRDGGYYRGDFNNGEISGKGERKWSNGNFYNGDFDQGELSGFGQMKYEDGRRYDGNWLNNRYEGQGTFHSGDGDIYTGSFHKHKRHGEGEQVRSDGSRYEGGWVNDKPHGHGTMKDSQGSVYEGQFNHGVKQGQGSYQHITGIIYTGLWINNEIPYEEFASSMAFLGSSEIDIYQGETFQIEIAVLHANGEVMEGDTGRMLCADVGLLPPPEVVPEVKSRAESRATPSKDVSTTPSRETPSLKETPVPSKDTIQTLESEEYREFETPFGNVKRVELAEVEEREPINLEVYKDEKGRPVSQGFEYVPLPPPMATEVVQRTQCGHASWSNIVLPGHEMGDQVDSDEEEVDVAEEKPKIKKKGKSSPAANRKERSATPEARDKWKVSGMRAERDKDLVKFAAPGTYIIKISDETDPPFFTNVLEPIYLKLNILRIKKSSSKFLTPIPVTTSPPK